MKENLFILFEHIKLEHVNPELYLTTIISDD